ncbi:MAG: hypothetical protein AB8H86_19235 [Polyangiales bacterium]
MRSSDLISFGAIAFIFAVIIGFVLWYMGKKKKIHAAQVHWASAVARLGGRELPQAGPGGTRAFEVRGGMLSVVNYVFLEGNIAKLVTPSALPNSWQSQMNTPCQRPTPPFKLLPGATSTPTGDPEFDARWSIVPLLGATQADVMALLHDGVRHALNALPAGTYQIASGGQQICAFREDIIETAAEVEAIATACALLAGQTLGEPQQQYGMQVTHSTSGGTTTTGADGKWKWHYSKAIGIMYGPIPVGIIIVVIGGLIYIAVR